ncbi:hypothetical protein SLA2020_478800 [Shorea laevis]
MRGGPGGTTDNFPVIEADLHFIRGSMVWKNLLNVVFCNTATYVSNSLNSGVSTSTVLETKSFTKDGYVLTTNQMMTTTKSQDGTFHEKERSLNG